MAKTPIQWAPGKGDGREGHTINPFRARRTWTDGAGVEHTAVGHFCVKISPGCKLCYASRIQQRLQMLPFLAENRQKVELFLDEGKLAEAVRRKKPTGYFWFDMTDAFLEEYPDKWLVKCFNAMAATPRHVHMILTKRPERMRDFFLVHGKWERTPAGYAKLTPYPHVHIGVSVESADYLWRIDILREIPAALRFISFEPLLGDVGKIDLTGIGWVIVGGESGVGARSMNLEWVTSIRDQCERAHVPFFMKQYGRSPCFPREEGGSPIAMDLKDSHGGDMEEWFVEDRVREFPA